MQSREYGRARRAGGALWAAAAVTVVLLASAPFQAAPAQTGAEGVAELERTIAALRETIANLSTELEGAVDEMRDTIAPRLEDRRRELRRSELELLQLREVDAPRREARELEKRARLVTGADEAAELTARATRLEVEADRAASAGTIAAIDYWLGEITRAKERGVPLFDWPRSPPDLAAREIALQAEWLHRSREIESELLQIAEGRVVAALRGEAVEADRPLADLRAERSRALTRWWAESEALSVPLVVHSACRVVRARDLELTTHQLERRLQRVDDACRASKLLPADCHDCRSALSRYLDSASERARECFASEERPIACLRQLSMIASRCGPPPMHVYDRETAPIDPTLVSLTRPVSCVTGSAEGSYDRLFQALRTDGSLALEARLGPDSWDQAEGSVTSWEVSRQSLAVRLVEGRLLLRCTDASFGEPWSGFERTVWEAMEGRLELERGEPVRSADGARHRRGRVAPARFSFRDVVVQRTTDGARLALPDLTFELGVQVAPLPQ